MKLTPILLGSALVFASVSCDKHSWKETQVLHENMHKGHGDSHEKEAVHAEKKETKH